MLKTVTVTREHWDRAVAEAYPLAAKEELFNDLATIVPLYCQNCVVAMALKDAGFTRVSVGKSRATLDGRRCKLPAVAGDLITMFDKKETMTRTGREPVGYVEPKFPITFEIEVD